MSIDGRITNFPADLEFYYPLAAQWNPDAILFGSETILAAARADPTLSDPLKAGIPELQVSLHLQSAEVVGDGIVWARYAVNKDL
ncbi:MAG: hypothetical protein WC379_11990 [Methanoregula sp.]